MEDPTFDICCRVTSIILRTLEEIKIAERHPGAIPGDVNQYIVDRKARLEKLRFVRTTLEEELTKPI